LTNKHKGVFSCVNTCLAVLARFYLRPDLRHSEKMVKA